MHAVEANLTAWRQQWVEPDMVLHHDEIAETAAFSPDGRHVVTGNHEGELTLWSIPSGEILWRRRAHQGEIERVLFSPDGARILTARDGDEATELRLWKPESGEPVGQSMAWGGSDVAFSPRRTVAHRGRGASDSADFLRSERRTRFATIAASQWV